MAAPGLFENVRLGARGTSALGTLNVSDSGITWKRQGVRSTSTQTLTGMLASLYARYMRRGLVRAPACTFLRIAPSAAPERIGSQTSKGAYVS